MKAGSLLVLAPVCDNGDGCEGDDEDPDDDDPHVDKMILMMMIHMLTK